MSLSHSSVSPVFVGIDVSKDFLDLARLDSDQTLRFDNSSEGIQRLVDLVSPWMPQRIVFEATGKLEQPLLDALLDANLNAARVNPAQARHFAKGRGIKAKTDAIDARTLALYGQLNEPRIAPKRSENQAELAELVTCRRQLVEARTAHQNQRAISQSKFASRQLDAIVKMLDQRIDALDERIRKIIDDDAELTEIDQILQSVAGVGNVLSVTLIALLGEIGQCPHRQLGALVGIAPMNRDSGRFKGQRHIQGGRAEVRKVLYVATVSAIRFNPIIKTKYEQLRSRGKPPKVAIIACAYKLLRILNALVRDRTRFTMPAK